MVLRCQAKNLGFLLCPKAERNGDILVLYPIMLAETSGQIEKLTFMHCRKRFAASSIAIHVVDVTRISRIFYSHVTFSCCFPCLTLRIHMLLLFISAVQSDSFVVFICQCE